MNTNASDHLHTNRGEHFALGKFETTADKQGTFQVEGDYPDVGGNTLYHLERRDGTKLNLTEITKDADSRKSLYHVKWA
jgi:hypothetical protein